MQTVLLIYDIPQKSPARNPSARLRRLGVRINLSCWVLPEENVPHQLLDQLGRDGASWHCAPFADSGSAQVVKIAVETMTREVERLTLSLERSLAGAEAGLGGDACPDKLAAFQRRTRAALRRAERILADSLAGAAALGIGADALPVAAARSRALAVRSAAHARAHLYAQAIERLAEGPLKSAALSDAVPAYAVADALEEQREDADALRAAFAG